jgi:hypothetical protein
MRIFQFCDDHKHSAQFSDESDRSDRTYFTNVAETQGNVSRYIISFSNKAESIMIDGQKPVGYEKHAFL